jgi:hypothetical protein
VTLTDTDGHVFVVNNVHIIDGSKDRKIPGANQESKGKYKQTAVRYVMQETERLHTHAATRGMITLGDINMDYDCANNTIIYADGPSPVWKFALGTHRGFMFSSLKLVLIDALLMPHAHDGQHTAICAAMIDETPLGPQPLPAATDMLSPAKREQARLLISGWTAIREEAAALLRAQDAADEAREDEYTMKRRRLEAEALGELQRLQQVQLREEDAARRHEIEEAQRRTLHPQHQEEQLQREACALRERERQRLQEEITHSGGATAP